MSLFTIVAKKLLGEFFRIGSCSLKGGLGYLVTEGEALPSTFADAQQFPGLNADQDFFLEVASDRTWCSFIGVLSYFS